MHEELFENLRLELRRGSLIVAVLAQLRTEQYGYTLCKHLSEQGLAVEEGTVYPLLRRLEDQGLLLSQWREENKRRKRFYRLSEAGEAILGRLLDEWRALNRALERVVSSSVKTDRSQEIPVYETTGTSAPRAAVEV